MRTLRSQRGIGWFGLLYILATLGVIVMVVIEVGPLYLNQMAIERAVHQTADDPEMANAEPNVIRDSLTHRWDADYIDTLTPKEVKIRRTEKGRSLFYNYEARVNLFYNIFIVIQFSGEEKMRPGSGSTG